MRADISLRLNANSYQCYYKLTQNTKLSWVKNKSFSLKKYACVTLEAKAGSSNIHEYLIFLQRLCLFLF